jgi:hypothetical protein
MQQSEEEMTRPVEPGEYLIIRGNRHTSGPVTDVRGDFVHVGAIAIAKVSHVLAHGSKAQLDDLLRTLDILNTAKHDALAAVERDYDAARQAALEASGLT